MEISIPRFLVNIRANALLRNSFHTLNPFFFFFLMVRYETPLLSYAGFTMQVGSWPWPRLGKIFRLLPPLMCAPKNRNMMILWALARYVNSFKQLCEWLYPIAGRREVFLSPLWGSTGDKCIWITRRQRFKNLLSVLCFLIISSFSWLKDRTWNNCGDSCDNLKMNGESLL